jgi:hypothetical protein
MRACTPKIHRICTTQRILLDTGAHERLVGCFLADTTYRDGAGHRRLREEHELLVEELRVLHQVDVVVDERLPVDALDPRLALVGLLLGKSLRERELATVCVRLRVHLVQRNEGKTSDSAIETTNQVDPALVPGGPREVDAVVVEVAEVLLGLGGGGGTQTFVVLRLPLLAVRLGQRGTPGLVLRDRVEDLRLLALWKIIASR